MDKNEKEPFTDANLTICSVFHNDLTRRILEINEDFVRKMNPGVSWQRFAANNTRNENIHLSDQKIREFPAGIIPEDAPVSGMVGYDAGSAMNGMLSHIKTRYVLFLDYDFFIVRPNWIKDVLGYMNKNKIGLLGVPYHPKFYLKVRYFPSQHCLFVDRSIAGKDFSDWDFMPQYSKEHLEKTAAGIIHKQKNKEKEARKRAFFPLRFLRDNIKKRGYIGSSKDIPYDLYRRYYGKNLIGYECFKPAALVEDFVRHYYANKRWNSLFYKIEKIVPEKWSYVPKQSGYFTFERFKDSGSFDAMGEGMEEYFWGNTPWGFHMRGFKERQLQSLGKPFDPEEKINSVKSIAAQFKFSGGTEL